MGPHSNQTDLPPAFGWLFIAAGSVPISAANGWVPMEKNANDAPASVIFLCGFVFVIGGVMLLRKDKGARLNAALATVLLLAMAIAGAWVAFISLPAGFGGGLPFFTAAQNIKLARVIFGAGALCTFWLATLALRQALGQPKGRGKR